MLRVLLSVGVIFLFSGCFSGSDDSEKSTDNTEETTDSSENCSSSTTPNLIVPFYGSDIDNINIDNVFVSADYADMENTPNQKSHVGWHYSPTEDYINSNDSISYKAMADGCITRVQLDSPDSNANTSVLVEFSSNISMVYIFEPNPTTDYLSSTQQSQLDLIKVSEGDKISQGDPIGELFFPEETIYSPKLHVHINEGEDTNCLSSYMSEEGLSTTEDILEEDNPDWQLCYE